MLVALLPVTALAAQEAGPVAASAVLENGTVTLTLTAGEETTSGRLTVAYDKELLTYAGLETKGTVTSEEAGGGRRDLSATPSPAKTPWQPAAWWPRCGLPPRALCLPPG